MTLAHRPTTALAAPSRRGFLKALGAFAAAMAVLPSVAKAVAVVERKAKVLGVKLPDGTVIPPQTWVYWPSTEGHGRGTLLREVE